jgi:ribosomal protein S18 acetylase RimI-like enzyme
VDDAAPVAAFAATAFRDTYAAGSRSEDVEAHVAGYMTPPAFAADLADPAVTLTVLEEVDGSVAGYVQLRAGGRPEPDAELDPGVWPVDRPTVEVARLYVAPRWHGRGVAAVLVGEAFAAATRAGGVAWLAVYEANPRAIAFYRKAGMRVAGTQGFDMGSERQRDWVMVWPAERPAGAR